MRIMTGQGIGDASWTLFKIEDYVRRHGGGPIDLAIACCSSDHHIEKRALDFLQRFPFLNSVSMYPVKLAPSQKGCVLHPGKLTDKDGRYCYIPDGPVTPIYPVKLPGIDHVLLPNWALENGQRLEAWQGLCKTNWDIHTQLKFTFEEQTDAEHLIKSVGEYCLFYLGPESGNTSSGMNRNSLWAHADWIKLGDLIHDKFKMKIVVIGAEYDRPYYTNHLLPLMGKRQFWVDKIGEYPINTTMAVIKRARCMMGHASGISISSHYFGVPTAIWWRLPGDSLNSKFHVSFHKDFATAWCNPKLLAQDKYLPLFYSQCTPESVMSDLERLKW